MAKRSRGLASCLWRLCLGPVVLLGPSCHGWAAETRTEVSIGAYQAQVSAASRLAAACGANATLCDSGALPGDERISRSDSGTFDVSWQWLKDALETAKSDAGPGRVNSMKQAQDHLAELANEAAGVRQSTGAAQFSRARNAANIVLSRDEFRAADGPTWLDRQFAKIQDWILQLFTGMDRLGKRAPWLAPLIEWGCFLLAAGGLVFFVRRSLARQALRIAFGQTAATAMHDGRDSADWARLAEAHASRQDWREAIHCLYWAAIVSLEVRRAWRPNPTRTPREYLKLLRPGADAQRALQELTRVFERVWYGHGEADEIQFRTAQTSLRAIEASDLQRSTGNEAQASRSPVPAGTA